jgi:hypothetical protein
MIKGKSKKSKKNQVGNRKAGSRINDTQRLIPHPPPIQQYNVVHTAKLRFVTSAAFVGTITWQNLLDCLLIATSGTNVFDVFYAVKIKYIEIWNLPVVGGSSTVSITFDGTVLGVVGNQITHTDSSMGIEPAHLKVSPGKKTLASMFQLSQANAAFFLDIPTGTVIDAKLVYKSSTKGDVVAAMNVGAGLTTGALYWRGLDGVAVAATKFTAPAGIAQA